MADEETEERFHPTSGRFGGVLGIGVAVAIAVFGVVGRDAGYAPWVYPACGLVAVLSWATLLRPRVSVAGDDLLLRQPFSTQAAPLAALGEVSVGRVLEFRVQGKRYVSAAIGRTPREVLRDRRQPSQAIAQRSYGDFVERRIGEHVENARRRVGDAAPGEVRRTRAWPEIAGAVASLVALVVTLLV